MSLTEELAEIIEEDKSFAVGQAVEVRWTNCGHFYSCPGTISKVNAKSIRAKLTDGVGPYPAGQEIIVPRLSFSRDGRWSRNNCVRVRIDKEVCDVVK